MRYGAESAAGRPAAAGAAAARPLPSAASNNTQQPKPRAKTRAAFFLLARAAFIGRAFFYPLRGDAPRTPRWRETARRIWPPKPEPVKQAKCGLPLLSDCRAARRNQDTKRRFFAAPRAPHKAHKLGMRDRKTALPARHTGPAAPQDAQPALFRRQPQPLRYFSPLCSVCHCSRRAPRVNRRRAYACAQHPCAKTRGVTAYSSPGTPFSRPAGGFCFPPRPRRRSRT